MPRPLTDKNRLSTNHPDLLAYIDPELNDGLTNYDVSSNSNKHLKWKCYSAGHAFIRTPSHAIRKRRDGSYTRCPECITLAFHNPDIAAQWHPTKNGKLTPNDVTYRSGKKVWWKCDNPECPEVEFGGYEWDATIASRTMSGKRRGTGCPACAGKEVTDRNRLTVHYPAVAAQWMKCSNCDRPADGHSFGSNHRALWKCDSHKCPEVGGYEWEVRIADRTISGKGRGTGCPACSGKVLTDNRLTKHPQIAAMVFPELNGGLSANDIAESSNTQLNLKCANGHEFKRSPNGMIQKQADGTWKYMDCPHCNTVAFCYPELIPEWHPTKNKKTPWDYKKHSNKKVWWICSDCEHEWPAVIYSRTQLETGCPACSGRVATEENPLTTHYPAVAAQWIKCLNCALPASEHTYASSHRAMWRCNRLHEWDAVIKSRTLSGNGCSKCNPQRSKREIKIACELVYVFPDISPNNSVRLDPADKRKLVCDIYIPSYKLVIEYDGLHWHQDKAETDIEKARQLEALGYKVLRLREAGLELLPNVHNIACNIDYYRTELGIKAVVDTALRYIAAEFGISNANTEAYLARKGLANVELAETIIANDGERQLPLPMQN